MVRLVTPSIFWSRVDFQGPEDCAIYRGPGQVTKSGHVRISVEGKKTYAHRYAYYLTRGLWPLLCCHHCDTPDCVSPACLYSGTPQDNVRDREARNRRTPFLLKRPEHPASRLTAQDIAELVAARAMGVRATVLAEVYGVSAETIRSVWRREALETRLVSAA